MVTEMELSRLNRLSFRRLLEIIEWFLKLHIIFFRKIIKFFLINVLKSGLENINI